MPRGRPTGDARYQSIAGDIVSRITKGEWPPGSPIPSSRKLERYYGVTTKTMLHALQVVRRKGLLAFGPRRKPVVTLGASFTALLRDTVVLVLSRPLAPILEDTRWRGAMYRGVVDAVKNEGWPLLTLQGIRWRTEPPTALHDLELKGVLLVGCPFKRDMLKHYELLNCPVVLIDHPAAGLKLHSIAIANYEFTCEAASKLIALGHRRIAFIRSIRMAPIMADKLTLMPPDILERTAGFEAACQRAKLNKSQYQIVTVLGDEGKAAVRKLLKAEPRFTAIVSGDEGVGALVHEQAVKLGLQVPRALSIVNLTATTPDFDWSGGQVSFHEFGRKAVALLRQKHQSPQQVRVPPEWRNGSTIAPPQ